MFKKMLRRIKLITIRMVDNYLKKKYPFQVIGWHKKMVDLMFMNESNSDRKLLTAMLTKQKLSISDYEKLQNRGYISRRYLEDMKFARKCTERVAKLREYIYEQCELLLSQKCA